RDARLGVVGLAAEVNKVERVVEERRRGRLQVLALSWIRTYNGNAPLFQPARKLVLTEVATKGGARHAIKGNVHVATSLAKHFVAPPAARHTEGVAQLAVLVDLAEERQNAGLIGCERDAQCLWSLRSISLNQSQ